MAKNDKLFSSSTGLTDFIGTLRTMSEKDKKTGKPTTAASKKIQEVKDEAAEEKKKRDKAIQARSDLVYGQNTDPDAPNYVNYEEKYPKSETIKPYEPKKKSEEEKKKEAEQSKRNANYYKSILERNRYDTRELGLGKLNDDDIVTFTDENGKERTTTARAAAKRINTITGTTLEERNISRATSKIDNLIGNYTSARDQGAPNSELESRRRDIDREIKYFSQQYPEAYRENKEYFDNRIRYAEDSDYRETMDGAGRLAGFFANNISTYNKRVEQGASEESIAKARRMAEDNLELIKTKYPEYYVENAAVLEQMYYGTFSSSEIEQLRNVDGDMSEIDKVYTTVNSYEGRIQSLEKQKQNRVNTWKHRSRGTVTPNTSDIDEKIREAKAERDNYLKSAGYANFFAVEKEYNRKKNGVAISSPDGDITWEELYNGALKNEIETAAKKNADFEEKSKYVKKDVKYVSANPYSDTDFSMKPEYGYEDSHFYNLVNGEEDAVANDASAGLNDEYIGDRLKYSYLTDEERAIFNYLWKTGDKDTAKKYVEASTSDVEARRAKKQKENDIAFAKEHPVIGSVYTVGQKIESAPKEAISTILDVADDGRINPNSYAYRGSRSVDTIRSTVEENINNPIGKFFYRHGMNLADNTAAMALGGFGAGGTASKIITTGVQSLGSFSSTVRDASERGLSGGEAIALGLISAGAETFFESKTFDSLFDGKTLKKSALSYLAYNIKTELVGELSTEAVNDIADALIAEDLSNWQLSIDNYMAEGLSKDEALRETIWDWGKKYADVAGGTLFSSGVMSGAPALGSTIADRSNKKSYGKSVAQKGNAAKVLDMAAAYPEDSSVGKLYKRYSDKGYFKDGAKQKPIVIGNLADRMMEGAYATLALEDATVEQKESASAIISQLESFAKTSEETPTTMYSFGENGKKQFEKFKSEVGSALDDEAIEGFSKFYEAGRNGLTLEQAQAANSYYLENFPKSVKGGGVALLNSAFYSGQNDRENGISAASQSFDEAESSRKGDTLEDSSIVLERDENKYPYDQREVIDGYENSVDPKTVDYVNSVRNMKDNDAKSRRKLIIGIVSDRFKNDVKRVTGIDFDGDKHVLRGSAVVHIDNRHGKNGEHDHSMAHDEDIGRIGWVIENYDSMEVALDDNGNPDYDSENHNSDNSASPKIKISKKINGTYYIVEAVPDSSSKTAFIKSAYISKKDSGKSSDPLPNMVHDTPQPTSETNDGYGKPMPIGSSARWNSSATDDSIAEKGKVVKRKNDTADGNDTGKSTNASENDTADDDEVLPDIGDIKKATGFGDDGAQLVAELMSAGKTLEEAQKAVKPMYIAGFTGGDVKRAKTDIQKRAFDAGISDKVAQREAARSKAKKATVRDGSLIENEASGKLSKVDREIIKTVAKDLGLSVSVAEKIVVARKNGVEYEADARHRDGELTLTGARPVFRLVLHEAGHRMEQFATEEWNTLCEALYERAEQLGRRMDLGVTDNLRFDRVKGLHDKAGITMDTSGYVGEVVMRELETIFSSPKEYNKWLSEISSDRKVKSAWRKFMDFVSGIIKKLRNALKNVGLSKDARARMKSELAELERIRGLYAEAYKATKSAVEQRRKDSIEVRESDASWDASFAFAGKKANSADISLLEQARDMENNGRNADEILKETGWYKGADGEWRFEIDDSKMEVNTSGKFTRDPEKRRYIELFDKVFLGTDASEQEVSELYELDKKLGKESFTPTKLGDLIKHPDLFKAYPELEDVNIAFVNTNENSDGAYDPILNVIVLERRNNIAPERLKGVLIHEIQHAIQKIENFARGASTEYWQAEINARREDGSRSAHDLYKNTAGEIEAREAENRKNLSAEERRERMPFVKNEKTVFTESLVKYYSANSNNDATIKEQIKQNSQMLNSMNPVIAIQNEGKQNRSKTAQLNAIMEDFTKKGFNVDRKDFGIISFDKDLINESLNYLNTNAEFAAFYTLHKVLKQGVVLQESHNNHKSRGYDTVTIAAPVIINGVRGNVAIVVKKTKGNRYKTHRILMPDGSRFAFAEKGTAEATTGRMTANNSGESLPITSAVDNSISQKNGVVKRKFALSNSTTLEQDTEYIELAKNPEKNEARLREMVDKAAKKAGYIPVIRYHQTGQRFTVFSNANPDAGLNDSDTPNGYFFKENDHDIGVGGDYVKTGYGGNIQMGVYLKHGKMLRFADRKEAQEWYTKNVSGYGKLLAKYEAHLADFEKFDHEVNEKMFDELQELDKSGKSTSALDLEIIEKYEKVLDEWIEEHQSYSDGLRADMRKLLNKYFIENDSGYDGIELVDDGHRYIDMKREDVHTFIVFKNTQIKSADLVTYDDNGNIIPLSERFNTEKNDIRHSIKEEGITSSEDTKELLNTIADLKHEFEITKFAKADPKKLSEMVRSILKDYSSKADSEAVMSAVDELYTYMANGEDGNPPVWNEVYSRALDIASGIVENAVKVDDTAYREYADLRNYLRNVPMKFDVRYDGVPSGYSNFNEFRKKNFGRLRFSNDGLSVDSIYQELAEMYPQFFDKDNEITTADQLERIADVLDEIRPIESNPYAAEMKDATRYLANDILDRFFDIPQAKPTFADKAERRVLDAKIEGQRKVEKAKAQRDIKIQKLRDNYGRIIQNVKNEKTKALDKQKAKHNESLAKMSESRRTTEMRTRIFKHASELNQRLVRGTDNKHIPQELQGAVLVLLESINLESNIEYVYGKDAMYHRVKRNTELGGESTKKTQAFNALRDIYSKLEGYVVIDPDLLGPDGILSEVINLADKRITDMTIPELNTVWKAIKAIEASVRSADKMFSAGKFRRVSDAAEGLRADNADKSAKKDLRYGAGLQKLIGLDMLTPETYFHYLGDTGDQIFRMMRDAQDKHISIMKEVADFTHEAMEGVNIKKLEKELKTVKLGGKEVTLTTAQLMELYTLMKRSQAKEHVFVGGILPDTIKGHGLHDIKAVEPVTGISQAEILDALMLLTEDQRKLADKLQEYASTVLGKYGNEASLQVYNYEKFHEKNYWPIRTNKQEISTDIEKDTAVSTVANKGMAKVTVPDANTSLRIGSIFDTFASHASDMATYAAWLGTTEDINRIRNFVFWEDGVRTGTVKGILGKVHGSRGAEYLQNLLADISVGVKSTNTMNPFEKLMGNYKAASIGSNFRVIIQQPTAILRAVDMMGAQWFAPAFVKNPLKGWDKAKKYAPIAQWKDWGYFDINTGRQMKDVLFDNASTGEKIKQFEMSGAGFADSISWGFLWNAVEAEIKSKHKGLEVESEAYYKAVAERFTEVTDHTQVVDGILQRSQIMRSGDTITKMATSFMGEPTKQYNMVASSLYDVINKSGKGKTKAIKHFGRMALALAISGVVNSAAQSIIDAMRDDDKEKKYWERWLTAFPENLKDTVNVVNYIPFVKDIVSIVQGYDVKRMDMETIAKTYKACENMIKSLKGEGKNTILESSLNLFAELARLGGYSVSNIKRMVTSIADTFAIETDNYLMQYHMEKAVLDINFAGNRSSFIDILYNAYNNDREAYEIIYNDLIENGITDEDIKDGMETRMKKAAGTTEVSDLDKRYMSPEDERRYDNKFKQINESDVWKKANEDQRKDAKADLYYFIASAGEKAKKTRKEAAEYGVDETEYVLWQLAKSIADNSNDNNDSMNEKEKSDAIGMLPGLGDSEIAYFYNTEEADKAYENGMDMRNYAEFKGATADIKGKGKESAIADTILQMDVDDDTAWDLYLTKYDNKGTDYARDNGIEGNTYLKFIASLDLVDKPTKGGKYGSYTQDEVKDALRLDMFDNLTREEKAVLWQSMDTTWAEKNNPYR